MRALMQRAPNFRSLAQEGTRPQRATVLSLFMDRGLIRMMGACSVGRTSWLGLNGATDGTLKWAWIAAGLSDRSYRPHIKLGKKNNGAPSPRSRRRKRPTGTILYHMKKAIAS